MITYLQKILLSDNKTIMSLDMVRFNVQIFDSDKLVELGQLLQWAQIFQYKNYKTYKTFKLFAYKDLFSFWDDEKFANFSFGFGLATNDKIDLMKGFIEFNPNKSYEFVKPFLERLSHLCEFELVRYDIAIDLKIDRSLVWLLRDDKRRYMKHNTLISTNSFDVTEYLGVRNTGGFVKLYNKQIESNLDYSLTRLELTCDDAYFSTFQKRLPKIYISDLSLFDIDKLDDTEKILFALMTELNDFSKLNFLPRIRKQKLKKIFDRKLLHVTDKDFSQIIDLINKIKGVEL